MSGNETSDSIFIRGVSSHNGITTLLIGFAALLLGAMTISLLPELFFLAGILIIAAGIIALVMGFFKIKEPKYSLEITQERLTYYHRLGKWHIDWHNIQRVDVPRIHSGLTHIDLEMVGFRLKDSEAFLANISPRLIAHLLMEQRPLLTKAEQGSCDSGRCYGDDVIDDAKYRTAAGDELRGIAAMFAHRMRRLQSGLGYDVFISVNELDRSAHEFVNLIRECHEAVLVKQIHSTKTS